jgi:N-acetylmuramoyl-L-alanine amidase
MSYDIIQKFINKNRPGSSLNAVGIVVHDTDTPGATAENEQNYFNNNVVYASAHAFVDWNNIIQTIPYAEVAWHAGQTANSKFLGVELCVPSSHDNNKFNEVWNRAVWYFAYLMIHIVKQTTVTKDNVLSHSEVSNRWHETDHTDPVAYFAEYNKTIDKFREEVQAEINLQLGNNNVNPDSEVLFVQQSLNRFKVRDYANMALVEDGIYGPRTKSAVQNFQSIVGLNTDGIIGPYTLDIINFILSKPTLSIQYANATATRYVQWRVNVTNDGMFGPITRNAVRIYQYNNGLISDGIVGKNTWYKLIG